MHTAKLPSFLISLEDLQVYMLWKLFHMQGHIIYLYLLVTMLLILLQFILNLSPDF